MSKRFAIAWLCLVLIATIILGFKLDPLFLILPLLVITIVTVLSIVILIEIFYEKD